MPNPSATRFVDESYLKGQIKERDVIIQNLRMQLETHRHLMKALLDSPSNDYLRNNVREFMDLPWGMSG